MNITIVGYGIQGRAQALNLRDSGNDVVIVNREDSYAHTALQDGFEILPMVDALKRAEVVFLLIPDAVQDEILKGQIFPNLCAGTTLVFAHGDFTITWVKNEHKEIISPYNTYLNAGLPPGPINLPEKSAIISVLNPARHDYIFMCAKPETGGYHNFAKTSNQHLVYARQYQKWNREFHRNKDSN